MDIITLDFSLRTVSYFSAFHWGMKCRENYIFFAWKIYNYNCHNTYWNSLIWRKFTWSYWPVYFIFQWTSVRIYEGRDIHGKTSFVILCSASMKRSGQSATTYALLYTYTYIFRWKSKDELTYGAQINMIHADLLPNAISPSFCIWTLWRLRTRHSRNARNVINWKRKFMENIIKWYLV